MRIVALILITLFTTAMVKGRAQTTTAIRHSTDVLCLVPGAVGVVKAWADHDTKGLAQWGLSTLTTLSANYLLEAAITKNRPDGTGRHAFPSTHSALAADGATFLMRRYGWQWGVPAYAVTAYVAWGRVRSHRHDWADVLAGTALGIGSAWIFTRPMAKKTDVTLLPATFGDDGMGVTALIRF